MDPSSGETNELRLPKPVMEQAPAGAPPEVASQARPESAPVGPETTVNPSPGAPAGSIPLPALPAPPMPGPMARPPAQPTGSMPASAALQASDDSDLIEKEWVNKAKQIVEHTRDDPHKQTEELSLVKVDYMKKRYNKSLKNSN